MRCGIRPCDKKVVRATLRVRPGGLVVLPPPLVRRLGGDATKLSVEVDGGRLFVVRRQSPLETRVARLRRRLAVGLGKPQP